MRRHNALISKILRYTERNVKGYGSIPAPEFLHYSIPLIHYHIGLCQQAGYLNVENVAADEDEFEKFEIVNITWKGHEALDKLLKRKVKR